MAFSGRLDETEILRRLYPSLQHSLDVDEVKPFLVESRVLTFEQCEELHLYAQRSTARSLTEKAILMVSHHPQCATQLLKALERTESASCTDSGHHRIIAQLKEQLGHLHMKDDDYEGRQYLNPGASNEPVPLLDYNRLQKKSGSSEKLRVQFALESKRILEHFASFCIHVGDTLQERGVTTDRVRALLQYRLGSKNIGEESMRYFSEAKSIHNLLCAAEPFASWFNYDVIAFLAKQLGGDEGLAVVADYESKFKQYLERLVFESPPFSSIKSIPSGFEELEVKLDWNFEQVTIQDVAIFKAKLCEFLDRSDPSIFILKSVEEGCVLLTWLVSSRIVEDLMAYMTKDLLSVYSDISSIRIGPKIFNPLQFAGAGTTSLLTLHETSDENMDQIEDSRLQIQLPESHKVTFPLVSPTSDKSLSECKGEPITQCTAPVVVRLREKKTSRQKRSHEKRKSSGYYSPVQSIILDSPSTSQRSSLVLDSTGRVSTSVHSSGYNSPVNSKRSSVQLDEEEEGEPHPKLQRTPSTEASFSSPVCDRSESPLITNKRIFERQKSSDSNC